MLRCFQKASILFFIVFLNPVFQRQGYMTVKLNNKQKNIALNDHESVAAVMQGVLKRENKLSRAQEHFWIMGLNNANKLLFIELLALGRHNRAIIHPPETFRMAIYKLAVKAVLVHNHPSGNMRPSAADIGLTDYLTKAGEFLNIDVLDHIIISETEHYSFAAYGLMQDMKAGPGWNVVKALKDPMSRIRLDMNVEEQREADMMEMARKMKLEGLADAVIKRLTGLKPSVIKKL